MNVKMPVAEELQMCMPNAAHLASSPSRDCSPEAPFVLHARIVTGVGGGPDKTILNSPRYLRALGYRAACFYLYPDGDPGMDGLCAQAQRLNAELIAWPDGKRLDFAIVRRLQALCRERNVSVWHAHDYKTNLLGLLVRRAWPLKLVTTLHGWGFVRRNPLYVAVGKACLPFYDAVVSVSDDLYNDSLRWRVSRRRAHLIPNAIDVEQYRRVLSIDAARQQLGAPFDGVVLAALGRLAPEKGFDRLIDAVAQLRKSGLPLTLWIGGEGPCRDALQHQIRRLAADGYVHLLGHLADPRLMLQAADLFVLNSVREGLPNVVLEAMSLETPVIATRVAGVPALIQDGHQGLLIDMGNQDQLCQAIHRLARDPHLREQLAAAARQRIVTECDFETRMRKISAVYQNVLQPAVAPLPSGAL